MLKVYTKLLCSVVITLCLYAKPSAQAFKMVRDINQQQDANPVNQQLHTNSYAVANGKAYFVADDGIHGNELWSSDGTAAGTALVKDIVPGAADAKITSIYAYKNKVYFFASVSNTNVTQLWISDGTAAGTAILKDSAPILSSVVYTSFNNELYFTLSDVNGSGLIRNQLWKTDGTNKGTKIVVAINTNDFSWTGIDDFIIFNNRLYFTTHDGQRLWSTNGTPGDTLRFTFSGFDIQSAKSYTQMTIKNDKLFFNYGYTYWQSGGDSASTVAASAYVTGPSAMIKNDIITTYYDNGVWLARFDTTVATKYVKLKKITSLNGYTASGTNGGFIQSYSDSLVYFYFTDLQNKPQLWATNGTADGTAQLLVDNTPSDGFTTFGNKLYFNHSVDNNGYELWSTDGSIAGTQMVKDINPGIYGSNPAAFTAFNSSLLFSAKDNTTGTELWRTDGTAAGTYMVKNINTSGSASSGPNLYDYAGIDTIGNKLLLTVNDGLHGWELWGTDGTGAGTNLLTDAFPGSQPADWSTPNAIFSRSFTRFKGADYYFSPTSFSEYGLFKTDGTTAKTQLASKLYSWTTGTVPLGLGATDNHLFGIIGQNKISSFNSAFIDTIGSKLFVYDGSGEAVIIKHGFFTPGAVFYNTSDPGPALPSLNNDICFFVTSAINSNGVELWKSDGTEDGTQMVTKIYQGKSFDFRNPQGYIKQYNGQIYFEMTDGFYYYYLWKTDLTAEGTKLVVSNQVPNQPMEAANNKLYFVASNNYNEELWVTDNTDAGTHLVKTGASMGKYVQIRNLTEFNNSLYFLALGTDSSTLWKTDGTEAGTVKVKSNVLQLTKGGGKLYFVVNNIIWQFDGTAEGTKQVDMTGLDGVTYISKVIYAGGKLYVSGYTYRYGFELYVSNIALPVTLLSFKGQLQGNNGLLQWATVNEQQNSHFSVQRSLHGNDFVTIGRVDAANGSGKQNNYTYIDAGITNLGVDKIYYRLQQVDLDGKSTYSKTVQLDVPVKSLYIAPNPATTSTAIYSQVNIPGAVIQVADISGKVLYSSKTNIIAGGKVIIPLAGYAKGLYTVTIQSAGTKQQEFKVVVE